MMAPFHDRAAPKAISAEAGCILFVGCGNMGAAILSGALRKRPQQGYVVLDRHPERARSLLPEATGVRFLSSPAELGELQPSLTVIGVKPQHFTSLSTNLMSRIAAGTVVSIMAGTPIARIAEATGSRCVARVMPNLAALVGLSMSVGYAAPAALTEPERARVAALMAGSGRFEWVAEEPMIDLATAVSGSGPGYAFAQHLVEAAIAEGMDRDLADVLVRQTLLGATSLLAADSRSAVDLKQAVCSPGGTTSAGLAPLEVTGDLPGGLRRAVAAAYRRACELAGAD